MRLYDLSQDAEEDLRDILRYTLKKWGREQVGRYRDQLLKALNSIARAENPARHFSERLPDVLVAKCEHHYIFYSLYNGRRPLILALFHERQDIVARLAHRLDG